MTPERYRQVKTILAVALEKAAGERLQFLDEVCQGDGALRQEVESLIAYGEDGSFLEHPVVHLLGEETKSFQEGDVLDRYRLIRRLGYGGMGTVYLAIRADDEFQQKVAVKLLRWQVDEDLVRRFRAERQILARLAHPNIARLYDGGTVEGQPYFAMEYVEGEPITRYCDSRRLSVRDRLDLFRLVCSAVHYAHQNLVVHRDLKPSNILVTSQGVPKLLDFGIAKIMEEDGAIGAGLTVTGLRPMTPDYASPEQIRGSAIATTSDIYSLGVVLYELLTGRRPHLLKSRLPEEIVRVILREEPEKPSVVVTREIEIREDNGVQVTLSPLAVSKVREGEPAKLRRRLTGDVDNIVLTALRKEPDRRYSSAAQLSEDIRRHLEGLPVLARKDTFAYRAGKFIRRNKVAVGSTFLVLLVLLGSLVSLLVQHQRTLRERDRAERTAAFLVEIFRFSDPAESRGDVVTARQILDQGAKNVERQLAGQPESQAAIMNTLGEVYVSLGLYPQAEELLGKALKIRLQHLGPDHMDIADSLENLGTLNTFQGKYEAAESQYRESLAMFQKILGAEDPRVTETLSNYGAFLIHKGDYAAAESKLREALERRRRSQAQKDENFAANLSNLASLLKIKGDYQEARSLFEEALQIRRQLYGEEHPSVALTLNNLGWLLSATGDDVLAKDHYAEALRLRRKLLGPDHPQVATTLYNMAAVLEDMGDFEAAERATREALDIWRTRLGPEHPSVASGLSQLAIRLRRRGDLEGAEQTFRESLAMRRRLLPAKHRDIIISLNNLAIILQDKGEYSEAELIYRESLRLRRELWGNEHRDVASALNNLATLLEDRGEWREAERLHRQALASRRRLLGRAHPDVLASMGNLASVLNASGSYDEAEALARQALQAARKYRPESRILSAQLENVLGESLLRSGRYAEAESLLVASYSAIRAGFDVRARPTQKALKRIVELYRVLGLPEKADKYEKLLRR
ncbi:MAG: eukaryotic-like serine/threonine-protein kinase [Acidobacteriota bacterium]|jgi:serine/threonine-protein kinase|nr:eukaryotic-like serine/threonine-protein kinase [Acidobacteriota bacterium]